MRFRSILTSALVGLCLCACQRDAIETYRAPKDPPAVMPGSTTMPMLPGMETPDAVKNQIRWKTPDGWQEQSSNAMRVGSFLIKDAKGQADVSIVPLSGDAGGDLANVNRWRGQIGLPMQTADAFAKASTVRAFGGHKMLWVDFANGGKRISAAIYKEGETSWFFKMMGDEPVVEKSQKAFEKLLNSTDFHGHAH